MTLCEGRYAKPLSYEKSVSHFGISASEVRDMFIPRKEYCSTTMPRFGKSVTRSVRLDTCTRRATDESDIPTGEGCSRYPEEEP